MKKTISDILNKVNKLNLDKQVIVVDDCSSDGTSEILKNDLKNMYDQLIIKDKMKERAQQSKLLSLL